MSKIQSESIIEEFQKAAQKYGIKKLAGEMDKAPSTLYAELNPWGDRSKSKLGLEDAVRMALLTGDLRGFELAAAALGCTLYRREVNPSRETAFEELAEDSIDFGEFAQAVNDPDIPVNELIEKGNDLIENIHETIAAKEKELWEKKNGNLR